MLRGGWGLIFTYMINLYGYYRESARCASENCVRTVSLSLINVSRDGKRFLQTQGQANTAGVKAAGADVESGHPGVARRSSPKLNGEIELSIDCHGGDRDKVLKTLQETGAKRVRSR